MYEKQLEDKSDMDEAEIYTKLGGVFRDVFDDDRIDIHPGLSPNEIAGWDSLMHLRLLLTIERRFKIKFSTAEIGELKDVGEIVSVIASRTGDTTVGAGPDAGEERAPHTLLAG